MDTKLLHAMHRLCSMAEEVMKSKIDQIVVLIAVNEDEPQVFVKEKDQYVEQLWQYINNYRSTH